jgi:NCAIR mutase (PurE)-related protein
MPVEDVQFARIDHHRALRQGFPEVIFGQGKTPAQVVAIAERIVAHGDSLLATRLSEEAREALSDSVAGVEWCAFGRTAFRPGADFSGHAWHGVDRDRGYSGPASGGGSGAFSPRIRQSG